MNRQPGTPSQSESMTRGVAMAAIEREGPPRPHNTVSPYLTVNDVPALIEFITNTFDGVVVEQIRQEDGQLAHTEICIGNSLLMIGAPEVDLPMPPHAQPRPGTFYVYVADVDETYRRAMENGANSFQVPINRFYGDRVAAVVDSNADVWWIATRLVALDEQQIQKRAEREWSQHPHGRD
jgi:PhnB protein